MFLSFSEQCWFPLRGKLNSFCEAAVAKTTDMQTYQRTAKFFNVSKVDLHCNTRIPSTSEEECGFRTLKTGLELDFFYYCRLQWEKMFTSFFGPMTTGTVLQFCSTLKNFSVMQSSHSEFSRLSKDDLKMFFYI